MYKSISKHLQFMLLDGQHYELSKYMSVYAVFSVR